MSNVISSLKQIVYSVIIFGKREKIGTRNIFLGNIIRSKQLSLGSRTSIMIFKSKDHK